ncbi:MAG: hypothetical protein U0Q16_01875 [Bryobacteraceae bacterium]
MPFRADHSAALWKSVQNACAKVKFEARRADEFRGPGLVMGDILREIDRAELIVCDVTGKNSNVMYELGLAHARTDRVIMVRRASRSRLPFDIAGLRCIFFDLEAMHEFERALASALRVTMPPRMPKVIRGRNERSRSVVSDLKQLLALSGDELSKQCVWFSGFLSTLAIGEAEPFGKREQQYRRLLLEDKQCMLELARRGCRVRLIISPPRDGAQVPEGGATAAFRLRTLLVLLEDRNEKGLGNLEFVISPHRQKHLYIIGSIAVSEGFKIRPDRGYELTLRQDDPEAVADITAAHEILFEELKAYTLSAYSKGRHRPHRDSTTTLLRRCAINALKQALAERPTN